MSTFLTFDNITTAARLADMADAVGLSTWGDYVKAGCLLVMLLLTLRWAWGKRPKREPGAVAKAVLTALDIPAVKWGPVDRVTKNDGTAKGYIVTLKQPSGTLLAGSLSLIYDESSLKRVEASGKDCLEYVRGWERRAIDRKARAVIVMCVEAKRREDEEATVQAVSGQAGRATTCPGASGVPVYNSTRWEADSKIPGDEGRSPTPEVLKSPTSPPHPTHHRLVYPEGTDSGDATPMRLTPDEVQFIRELRGEGRDCAGKGKRGA